MWKVDSLSKNFLTKLEGPFYLNSALNFRSFTTVNAQAGVWHLAGRMWAPSVIFRENKWTWCAFQHQGPWAYGHIQALPCLHTSVCTPITRPSLVYLRTNTSSACRHTLQHRRCSATEGAVPVTHVRWDSERVKERGWERQQGGAGVARAQHTVPEAQVKTRGPVPDPSHCLFLKIVSF